MCVCPYGVSGCSRGLSDCTYCENGKFAAGHFQCNGMRGIEVRPQSCGNDGAHACSLFHFCAVLTM